MQILRKNNLYEELNFAENGLLPAIIQDSQSRQVLMLAYVNREAIYLSVETGEVHFYSRSRAELWHKGKTSGNKLLIQEICLDCDGDTLLILVSPAGPACHTGETSCFFRKLEN
jgi:phosphoribosyl-AMP cyclohydrolase / phosphoribosyl-ATP pyrophosphohydrolase